MFAATGKDPEFWGRMRDIGLLVTIELGGYGLITLTVELWKESCHSEIFLVDTTDSISTDQSTREQSAESRAVLATRR